MSINAIEFQPVPTRLVAAAPPSPLRQRATMRARFVSHPLAPRLAVPAMRLQALLCHPQAPDCRRIAAGSGMHVQEVIRLLNEFDPMQGMMKKMKGSGMMKMIKPMGGMKGTPKF